MSTVFATAADAPYGYHLLNLLGSVKANSDVFDRIVVHDLGLDEHQRSLLDAIDGIDVREVPPFVPHWAQGFTWKAWIWTHLDADTVFWLDAGATVLRSLEPALDEIRARGYLLVSQGNRLSDIVPSEHFGGDDLSPRLAGRPYVAAGVIGFSVGSDFYDRVVLPTYEDCLAGESLGFSAGERSLSRGLNTQHDPPVRDCPHFRWDQSVLNLHVFRAYPDPVVNDVAEYGGYRSPRDHPEQKIWHHRRQGNLAYLARVPYSRDALRGRLFGLTYRLRWWLRMHERFFRPTTYALKARKILSPRP